jgi:hypothetical protein
MMPDGTQPDSQTWQSQQVPAQRPPLHATEGAAEGAAASESCASPTSLVFARQIIRDGEIIELIVKPSVFWIVFTAGRLVGLCAIVGLSGWLFDEWLPGRRRTWVELSGLAGLAWLVWQTLKWMSRIHVLTNLRVITISGVFNPSAYECPLRKHARVRLLSPLRERLLMLGTLELIPLEDEYPLTQWRTIRSVRDVHKRLQEAIRRARAGNSG